MAKIEHEVCTRIVLKEPEIQKMQEAFDRFPQDSWIRIVTGEDVYSHPTMNVYIQGPDGEEELLYGYRD